jgi:hypothetical protein
MERQSTRRYRRGNHATSLSGHVETEEVPEELLVRGVRLALESGGPIAHVAVISGSIPMVFVASVLLVLRRGSFNAETSGTGRARTLPARGT